MMKKRPFLTRCLTLGLGLALLPLRAEESPAVPENLQLFLLIGQSNMAGRGKVTPADKKPHPRIFSLGKNLQWKPATDPLHFDKPGMAGTGLASEFARQLVAQDPDLHIGLIPCAFGGTSLSQWQPDGKLYRDAITRTKAALKNGQLAGILWHQGEADSSKEKMAAYPKKFDRMMTQLRKDLSADGVPLLIGELPAFRAKKGDTPEKKEAISQLLIKFNAMLGECAERHEPAALVSAADLSAKSDNTHFDRAGLLTFGQRYAASYLELTK
ncbi:MAG: sialate O-acetylesterase [Verrucomicrobiales bacterium]